MKKVDHVFPNFPSVDILGSGIHKDDIGIFIGQSRTHLVRGRAKYKVNMTHAATAEDPQGMLEIQDLHPRKRTALEEMYHDFCQQVHNYLLNRREYQGENHSPRIVFPDFHYEVLDKDFKVI